MTRSLPWILCALIALVCAPALALGQGDPGSSGAFVVSDSGFRDASGTDPADRTVDILVGGRVDFSYPSGTGEYNVVWDRGSLVPASCEQTAGPIWGHGTTLPWWTQGPGWADFCTFTAPGTYTFHSGTNPDGFKGTVVVHATGTPTPTPTVTATPTPTATPPSGARITARDNAFENNTVTIQAGGKVTFGYPAGANYHNVDFRTAAKPSSCVKTKPSPTLPVPDNDQVAPMPDFAQPPGWEGECTFTAPGTYSFVCSTHPVEMTGTVIVEGTGGEPTPTPTPTATPTQTPTATPTVAPGRPGIVARDRTAPTAKNWFQDAASSDESDATVNIAPGGTVDFSYPAGANVHNVVFVQAPSSCVQKTGVAILPAPPLPQFSMPPGWSGECTFATPGVYTFVCQAHPVEMEGRVVVGDETEPTPTPTPTATPEPERDIVPARAPKAWAAIDKPKTNQTTVAKFLAKKLTVTSRCVSAGTGTLTMTAGKQLAAKLRRSKLRQGALVLATADATCNQYGRFTVKLKPTAEARDALEGFTRAVPVTLTLTLAGPIGTTTATRTITLKGKGRR